MSLIALALAALNVTAPPCHVGDVEAYDDASLKVLSGVTCLRGSLEIRGTVTSLAPLRALTLIEGDLRIGRAERLSSLRGLDRLTRVTGHVGIGGPKNGLPRIRRLAGLNALVEVGGLFIGGGYVFHPGASVDAPLHGIDGLRALARVNGDLELFDVRELRGLNALTEITGSLTISMGPAASLDGLRRLRRIGGTLYIQRATLRDVRGLAALTAIGGDVEVNCGGAYAPRLQRQMRRQLADVTVKGRSYYGTGDDPRSPIIRCPHLALPPP